MTCCRISLHSLVARNNDLLLKSLFEFVIKQGAFEIMVIKFEARAETTGDLAPSTAKTSLGTVINKFGTRVYTKPERKAIRPAMQNIGCLLEFYANIIQCVILKLPQKAFTPKTMISIAVYGEQCSWTIDNENGSW